MIPTVALVAALAAATTVPTLELVPTHTVPASWGTTFKGKIHSVSLGADRTVDLFLPATFDKTTRKFPIIFLTDGEYNFERAVIAARELSEAGHIPECLVAAVETPERRQDLTPPGMSKIHSDGPDQRGDKFLTFLVDELEPALKKQVRGSAPVVLMGHSHGGILCHHAAATRRDDIPFIVSLDAPMHLDDFWLARELMASVPRKGSLRLVVVEAKFGWKDRDWFDLQHATPGDWELTRRRLKDEDHQSMVFGGFYTGLKELFADYSVVGVRTLGRPRRSPTTRPSKRPTERP